MKKLHKTPIATACALALTGAIVTGCGGSSSSSDDESTITSRGMITGFGSVYVNGKRFGTGATIFEIDDANGLEGDLRIGMIVTVEGSTDDNGRSWHAEHIAYDNELKGPVSSIIVDPLDPNQKIATILGQTVLINLDTVIDDDGGLTFAAIAIGDVLEVSGFISSAGLVATHIELQDNADEIEIRGYIENLLPGSFEINGFAVSYDGATELDDIGVLTEGLYVEVEGQLNGAGTVLLADKIEAEDDALDDDSDDAEIEGMISDYDPLDLSFMILGQPVDASSATFIPASMVLADDLIVEVEGHIVNGILIADEVKQRGEKTEISAPLSAVGASSVTFSFAAGDILVQVNHQTELEDDTGNPLTQLSDLNAGDFVELEAFEDGAGVINAVEIERRNPDEIEIEAAVDRFDSGDQTVVLLGVEFDLSGASFENENDVSISAIDFFNSLSPGEFIEIEDSDRNGLFDKAELED